MLSILSEIKDLEKLFPEKMQQLQLLGCQYEEAVATEMQTEEDLIRALCTYDVIVTCDQHNWTRKMFSSATKTKLLLRLGKGVDNVDVAAATDSGILIANTGSANATAVAEHAVAMILAAVHHLPANDQLLHAGDWDRSHVKPVREIKGRIIGLAGFGAIAQHVATMLSGFSPKEIIAYDPYVNEEAARRLNVRPVTFDELLQQSDIISIHAPLMNTTRHMFNKEAFEKMREQTIIINTARGPVVDEQALYDYLKSGKVEWAGLDVFEQEPIHEEDRGIKAENNPLLKLQNVFGSPHVAAHSRDAAMESQCMLVEEMLEYAQGKRPRCTLN